jgi:adenine-specific DNA-methyltransferase
MTERLRQTTLPFDLDHSYLKKQLIAYIGNKRSLQPLLYDVFSKISIWRRDGGHSTSPAPVFLDPFAGSGSVTRLARYLGYRVLANDWEYYAYVLNFAHLCIGSSEARELFGSRGGPVRMLAELNALTEPPEADRYISSYYAPASTETADYRSERLFYTRENALIIDAIRSRIEELYPGLTGTAVPVEVSGEAAVKEKRLLLASLLYQCATHTNTSGVFKACHKGFGGHSRDALGRILSLIRLQMPIVIDAPEDAEVSCQDALRFVRSRPADLCYLDPPYNQHQYGSNYHLLNTIALWDKPAVNNELRDDGRLKHKAGIRRDWVKTRSAYCYRRSACAAFRKLLEAIDARYVVLSYNTEGIIPFEELVELLASQGRVELFSNEYVKYRGGKQSIARQVHNLEFVLLLDRDRSTSGVDRKRLERAVLANRVAVAMKRSFCPAKIRRHFSLDSGKLDSLPIQLDGKTVHLPMPHLYRFPKEATEMIDTAADLRALLEKLRACECVDRQEEIQVLVTILKASSQQGEGSDRDTLQKRILWLLRKFAHRKYRERFERTVTDLRRFADGAPEGYPLLLGGLEEVNKLARARFEG